MGRRRVVRVNTIFEHFLSAVFVLVLLLGPGARADLQMIPLRQSPVSIPLLKTR